MSEKEKSEVEPSERIADRLDKVDNKIVVISGKGGVGKSTVAANLAVVLQLEGYKTGLVDCDMHGPSIPKIIGLDYDRAPRETESGLNPVETEYGLKVMSLGYLLSDPDAPVIWRGPLKMRTIQKFLGDVNWGELDYLIFDLPPGTGDEPLSVAQLIPDPKGSVIVTTPQEVALQTIRRAVNFSEKVNLPVIGLIENMGGFVCPECGEEIDIFGSGGGESLSEEVGIDFLGRIPLSPEVVESGEEGTPFVTENSELSENFRRIADKIEDFSNQHRESESG